MTKFDDFYKRVRNRLRCFTRLSIALEVLRQVNAPAPSPVDELGKAVWQALLIVKWAYQDGMGDRQAQRVASAQDIHKVRQLLWEGQALGSTLIGEHNTAFIFVRQLLRAQIEMQRLETKSLIREEAILGRLSDNHKLRKMMRLALRIDVHDLMDLKLAAFSGMKSGSGRMSPNFLKPLLPHYGRTTVQRFLNNIALDHQGLREYCLALPGRTELKKFSEYFELPVLTDYPVFFHSGTLYWWHRMVFARGLEGLLHRRLGSHSQEYIDAYGDVFEDYSLSMLPSIQLDVLTEKELQARFGNQVKLPDAVVCHPKANVIVECKSLLNKEDRMTAGSSRVFLHKMKSVIKAVEQAHSLSHEIRKERRGNSARTKSGPDFLLVVCNIDLMVGNLFKFEEVFARKKKEFEQKYPSSNLPIHNMYVIAIDEFEKLISAVEHREIDLFHFLQQAAFRDSDQKTAKYTFEQHLSGLNVGEVANVVSQALKDSQNRIESVLSP